MKHYSTLPKLLNILFFCFLSAPFSYAQKTESPKNDTTKTVSVDKERLNVENKVNLLITDLSDSKQFKLQKKTLQLLVEEIELGNTILKNTNIHKNYADELKNIKNYWISSVKALSFNKKSFHSVRNLAFTKIMLEEIDRRNELKISEIKKSTETIILSQNRIDSLLTDKILYHFPKDSIYKKLYLKNINSAVDEVSLLNSRYKQVIDSLSSVNQKALIFKNLILNNIKNIDNLNNQINPSILEDKYDLLNKKYNPFTLKESVIISYSKEYFVLGFYLVNHSSTFLIIFLITLFVYTYLKILKKRYKQIDLISRFNYVLLIFEKPFMVSVLIAFTIGQFLFNNSPYIFNTLIWLILLFVLLYMLKDINNKTQKLIWSIFSLLFLFNFFINNLLIPSIVEVYLLSLLSIFSIVYFYILYQKHSKEFKKPMPIMLLVGLGFEIIGLISLIYGNYNFGKLLIVNGVNSLFISLLLVTNFYLISDIFFFSNYVNEKEESLEVEINFEKRNHYQILGINLLLFIYAWFVLIFSNTYWYQFIIDPIQEFLTKEQKLGDVTFTYWKITLFFVVIFISSLLSKIITFLTLGTKGESEDKKNKVGNWMLLIRIGIISSGTIIAFVISGFPLDRVTMIISALGVGIGFGMQAITNNLISGIILAFEKPINLGDIIEVGGKFGRLKSMGIRSSSIITFNGSTIIIPNGELLNQNLINWTLDNPKKRNEMKLGVSYDSDVQKVKEILTNILSNHPQILKVPSPIVLFMNFGDSSIEFVIKYWVTHFLLENDVHSDIMFEIEKQFRENGITIPFPQRDVHIINQNDTN